MPKKTFTYHTIESLMHKTIDVGECIEWQGYVSNNSPQVFHGGKILTVRRLILELQSRPVNTNFYIGCNCGNKLCVNPDHFVIRNKTQHYKYMNSNINYEDNRRTYKLQQAAKGRRKITDEQALFAMSDSRNCREVAEIIGVSKSLISKIRRRKAYKQVDASKNPWSGLIR